MMRAHSLIVIFLLSWIGFACKQNSQDENDRHLNRLASASSPYLYEHADNPVDWYEWGPEALKKAKEENKPLIISIGYASCHWCHVMEEESFMDTAVARMMNQDFVCIKIDREERPDIDQIYLQASQLISGNAGWPMNAFALPDGKPFYAVTYLPRLQWTSLLKQVIEVYRNEKENVIRQADELTKGIQQQHELITLAADTVRVSNRKLYEGIVNVWGPLFDQQEGGLSGSPKFPMPVIWEFLLQHYYLTGNEASLQQVTTTLDKIATGGIYDHLAGGFARYSTDDQWKVPHFEKMLYDNGQLISLYAHAYQVTKDSLYADVIRETLSFIKREMTSPEGGFYSSMNADSEGEEGKFYVWTKNEIENVVDKKEAEVLNAYYQLTDSGNWEKGKNVLYPKMDKAEFAAEKKVPLTQVSTLLESAEQKLLQSRDRRVHPTIDKKVLTSWNALMLKAYIDAYHALGDPSYLQTALTNARFIEKAMMQADGSLQRNYHQGKASIDGFLEDYVLLAKSFISLYQATFDVHWLENAKLLTTYSVEHFRDTKSGFFFFTSDKSEHLIARKLELTDNVMPSSNSVMAEVLYMIGEYYGISSYRQMSFSMLNAVTDRLTADGPTYSGWATLMGILTYNLNEVAILGENAEALSRYIQRHYNPTSMFMGGNTENLPLLKNKLISGKTLIYICRNKVCKLPLESPEKAIVELKAQVIVQ
jgi:hypothetical protein